MKLYQKLANVIVAYRNCSESENMEWMVKWSNIINEIRETYFPHGSGFDNNHVIEVFESDDNKIIIYTDFHSMDENGGYDGWYDYKITVKGNLAFGFKITIMGKDHNGLKDYVAEVFEQVLNAEYIEPIQVIKDDTI